MGCKRQMLTVEDREEISRGVAEGLFGCQNAARIGRDPSVVSREIARHGGRGGYRAYRADQRACKRRSRPKCRKLEADARLRAIVITLLGRGWSPDMIAGRLPIDYRDEQAVRVSHEAIYTWIYALPVGKLAEEGLRLRSGRARRKPRDGRVPRSPRITGIRWIDERPAEAAGRRVPGHWEGDLIIGRNGASAASTLVERVSRFLVLVPVAARDSGTVTAAVGGRIAGLPEAMRQSLTWDCGSEMAQHAALLRPGVPVLRPGVPVRRPGVPIRRGAASGCGPSIPAGAPMIVASLGAREARAWCSRDFTAPTEIPSSPATSRWLSPCR